MKTKHKVLFHITALVLFLLGIVVLHVDHNYNYLIYQPPKLFGFPLNKCVIFDGGLLLVGLGFFIEFFLTFKPIKILEGNINQERY